MQRLGGIRDAAATINREKRVERIAIHVDTMQKTDVMERINKFA
jgi:hypothetical protein